MTSRGPSERRLHVIGVAFAATDAPDHPDVPAGAIGLVILGAVPAGTKVTAYIWHGVAASDRESYSSWLLKQLSRFAEHGPVPDGWQLRSDGLYQKYVVRRTDLDVKSIEDIFRE
jgi:hypothetical protein